MTDANGDDGFTAEQRAVADSLSLTPAVWQSRIRSRPTFFMACMDQILSKEPLDAHIQLPAFPSTKDIAIFSDYGGDHDESPVLTYTFLIVDFGALETFGKAMKDIRDEHKLGRREIAFKQLNSGAMTAAVPKIMRAADRLPGLLFTLAVNKKFKTILGSDEAVKSAGPQLQAAGIQSWTKPKSIEDVVRKVHCVAYWLSMLAREGMGVLWMTDNDSIMANERCIEDLRKFTAGACDAVGAPKFRIIGLARQFERTDEQPYFNDALAVADLTAGSIAAAYTDSLFPGAHSEKKIPAITDVLTLHAHQGVFLKKLVITLDRDDSGQDQVNTFWIGATNRSQEGYLPYVRKS
jgi:hypothetical protein